MYDTDGIYNLKEQHDSYVWDYVRKEFENRGTKNYDIGDGKAGHVQARSILGTIYDHTKGERKIKGRSKEFRFMINIFIGYDSKEKVAYNVLSHSIIQNSTKPVAITPIALNHLKR